MAATRETIAYLVISPKNALSLSVRAVSKPPRLAADEIAMALTVKVPDAIFKKPTLTATIEIPEDSVSRPTIDAAVVDNIKAELQRTLGVDLQIAVVS